MIYPTDKPALGYYPVYEALAAELGPAARICEIGVLGGGSLVMWRALFPSGDITGVDCDPGCIWPEGTRRVVRRGEDPDLPNVLGGTFDLVVDDGGHQGDATEAAFHNLWPLVRPGGYYVIEDWWWGLPAFHGFCDANPGILHFVQGLMPGLLADPTGQCDRAEADQITYRWGLCVIHKRGSR